jgi:hypothetical protein
MDECLLSEQDNFVDGTLHILQNVEQMKGQLENECERCAEQQSHPGDGGGGYSEISHTQVKATRGLPLLKRHTGPGRATQGKAWRGIARSFHFSHLRFSLSIHGLCLSLFLFPSQPGGWNGRAAWLV